MKQSLTDKLLLIMADLVDFNRRCSSLRLALAMDGDPRLNQTRRRLERCLENKKKRQKLYNAFNSLKRNHFLQDKVFGNSHGYILTPKGQQKIFRLRIKNLKKEELPGGHYLMVFFDIPERIKAVRDNFRDSLRELGFEMVQKSIWVTSYKVFKEARELIKNYGLKEHVKLMGVKEIEIK